MREGWTKEKIGDCCKVLSSKRIFAKDYVQAGVPFYRSKEIIHKALNQFTGDELYITKGRFEEIKKKFGAPVKGDLLISSVGNRSGIAYKVREEYDFYFKDGNLIWLKDFSEKLSSDYLEYFLKSVLGQGLIANMMIGAAQKALTIDGIKKIKISLPPLPTQRKIATILSAYDDLIENNIKRIKLLEEKAQLTYEEWFVRMKFPGHETVVIDAETGLPEGWKKGKLSELIDYQSGFAYKSARFTSEGFPVIKIKNIGNNTIDTSNTNFIDEVYAIQTDKFRLKAGDLLIAMTGATVGKVGVVPITKVPCYLNQRVGRFLKFGNIDNTSFVNCFFSVGGGLNHVLNIAGGAAQPNISAKQILAIDSITPPASILEKFSELAITGVKENLNLQNQIQLLKEARDILLPRLMTGMIDVEKIDVEKIEVDTLTPNLS